MIIKSKDRGTHMFRMGRRDHLVADNAIGTGFGFKQDTPTYEKYYYYNYLVNNFRHKVTKHGELDQLKDA